MREVCFGLALGAVLAAGCEQPSDYSSLELVEVTGQVTMDQQPLPGVTVRFEGPPRRFSEGQTDGEGKYLLMYDSTKPGCTPGEKVVRIVRGGGEGSDEEGPVEGPDGQVIAAPVQTIPAAYNSASTLNASVSASNKTFNFDLKSQP